MDKKIFFIILFILSLNIVISQETSVCCEKTTYGAWCQNDLSSRCDESFKTAPTSCDATSYCKLGCCFDSQEGLCMENTPQRVCEANDGTWNEDAECNIKQCNLGCCILGDQAALTTLTRCKSLAGYYGLDIDFRGGISDEVTCINTANSQDKGACVFEDVETGGLTCTFTTRGECGAAEGQIIENVSAITTQKTFYDGILCSAEELGVDCGPSQKTMIIEGRDEVYYRDTCGNRANIYDSNRYNDDIYWKEVFDKSESCGYGQSNANSKTCGNCDYFLGSIGQEAPRLKAPIYGDYYCADLNCDGHQHGESWCLEDEGAGGDDRVGSKFYKAICLMNEILIEPCADFRNEICIENEESFSESACIVNRWQDCITQEEKDDCENIDARECVWKEGYYYSTKDGMILPAKANNKSVQGICVPKYAPGFQFWGDSTATSSSTTTSNTNESMFGGGSGNVFGTGAVSTTSADSGSGICSMGNSEIIIEYEEKYEDIYNPLDWDKEEKCKKNCEYAKEEGRNKWVEEMNAICKSLGDCGGDVNYIGVKTEDGYAGYYKNERFAGGGGAETLEEEEEIQTTTSSFILNLIKELGGNK